jgi:hypothetical protein
VTNADLSRMEKTLFAMPLYRTETYQGKKALNQEGDVILRMAADILQRQKKKNPIQATMQAVRKYRLSMSQMPQKPKNLPSAPQAPAQPTAQQKASQSVNTPLKQEVQALIQKHGKTQAVIDFLRKKGLNPDDFSPTPNQNTEIVMQKINTLKARGISDDKIREALKTDGYNPTDYGYAQ